MDNIENIKNIINNYKELKSLCGSNIDIDIPVNIEENVDKLKFIMEYIKNDINRIFSKLNEL